MRVVLCNCPPDHAERIARILVDEGRAACVSMTPVRSCYRWDGKLCVEDEVTLVIKVAATAAPALRDRLRALHPYELPEIVALPVDEAASHAPYVEWVRTATAPR
jgi:periplasmic divalent cation tolerance protein